MAPARGSMRVALLIALCAPVAQAGATSAERFTLETPPLARSQFELLTISAPPDAVTGGDVLLAVRGLRDGDSLRVTLAGRSVTRALRAAGRGERRGLVDGLRLGPNRLVARVRRAGRVRQATLIVRNHPVTGPVISGPQQQPFYCQTEDAGLGRPLDDDCSIATRYDWYYRSRLDLRMRKLDDPYAPYPDDAVETTTSDGRVVPFVVRVESATINRGIARIAVLDDPHARGPDAPFEPAWNHRLTYGFGESCGVGYRQGSNVPQQTLGGVPDEIGSDAVFAQIYGLGERLGEGDAVAISTMTTFGVYCNPFVSAETLMMIKEHIAEAYGTIERTMGVGGSGGALQQYSAANTFPGLVDAAAPVASFADIPSTAMTVVDCGLLSDYFARAAMPWSDSQRAAVAGHRTARICPDWVDLFLSNIDPRRGCSGVVPDEVRYDAERNPRGVRCTLQDATVNFWGRDPQTGFANRPYDNVGVQYGLRALNAGVISVDQFIDLNRSIGGYDIDGRRVPQRSAMTEEVARRAYRLGLVIGRGALEQTPIVDLATYLDLVPLADIHDVVRPFEIRARLRARRGTDTSQSIWRGVSAPPDARADLDRWLDAVAARGGDRARAVAAAKPAAAGDRCILAAAGAQAEVPDGVTLPLGIELPLLAGATGPEPLFSFPIGVFVPERQEVGLGACDAAFPAGSGTRIVAGGPLSDDVLKCALRPVDPGDYRPAPTPAQLDELRAIFPGGVCDWSRPGAGEVERSMVWPTLGGDTLLEHPRELRWRVARSRTLRR